jgi:hypothetical protein
MRLRLQRSQSHTDSTIGALYEVHPDTSLSDRWCYTCEDVIREIPGVDVAIWKVATQTAIPAGRYAVTFTWSPRFHRELLEVHDVPGFTGIRIHPGNTSLETDGCILPGMETDGTRVLHSRMAYNLVAARLEQVMETGEQVWLEVRNP